MTGADDDSDDESDDESDYSESEEESESETGGLDLDVCPMGCDQTIYDNTCMLREKRLDVEEALTEEKKNRDMLNKELESMQKRAKVIETSAKAAETDLEAFQVCMLHIKHASLQISLISLFCHGHAEVEQGGANGFCKHLSKYYY